MMFSLYKIQRQQNFANMSIECLTLGTRLGQSLSLICTMYSFIPPPGQLQLSSVKTVLTQYEDNTRALHGLWFGLTSSLVFLMYYNLETYSTIFRIHVNQLSNIQVNARPVQTLRDQCLTNIN